MQYEEASDWFRSAMPEFKLHVEIFKGELIDTHGIELQEIRDFRHATNEAQFILSCNFDNPYFKNAFLEIAVFLDKFEEEQ